MPIKAVKDHISEHISGNLISRHWKDHISSIYPYETSKNNLEFRKFRKDDIDKSAKLFKEVFSDYPWYDEWTSIGQVKNYLMELIENPVFEGFVAYEDNEIIAACFGNTRSWWMGKEFFIIEFYVSKQKQGNGIGTKLMEYVKDDLIKEDYERLILLTNTGIPAEEFYLKNGFLINNNRISMFNELKK